MPAESGGGAGQRDLGERPLNPRPVPPPAPGTTAGSRLENGPEKDVTPVGEYRGHGQRGRLVRGHGVGPLGERCEKVGNGRLSLG